MDKETKKRIEVLRKAKADDMEIASILLRDGYVATVQDGKRAIKSWWEEEMKRSEEEYYNQQNLASKHIEELNLQLIRGENNTYNHRQREAELGLRTND